MFLSTCDALNLNRNPPNKMNAMKNYDVVIEYDH